jgi:uncharacterized protein (TIGR03435 family)
LEVCTRNSHGRIERSTAAKRTFHSWAASEKFEIEWEADGEGVPSLDQWKVMLRKMMADRFHLAFHTEKWELSVYTLTVSKTGMKLRKSLNQDGLAGLGLRGPGSVVGRSANIGNFRNFMQGYVMDRPVLDQTGIEGRYDFQLDWTPDEFQFQTLGVKAPPRPITRRILISTRQSSSRWG